MAELARYAGSLLLLAGSLFGLIAALGVLRLPDLYTRLHAASKAGAVGGGMILLAVALVSFDGAVALRALIGIGFLLMTSPVAAHLLARASYKTGNRPAQITASNDLEGVNKASPDD
ncbi:MAG: monovalent cation/H(+) antiporter subunit G [Devosia sp.]